MDKRLVGAIAAAVVVGASGVFFFSHNGASPSTGRELNTVSGTIAASKAMLPMTSAGIGGITVPQMPGYMALGGYPMDLGGKTVGQYIKDHSAAARIGDAKEAYKVYAAESICASKSQLASAVDQLPRDQQTYFRNEIAQIEAVCADATPAEIQERLNFLATAAKARIPQAETAYFFEGPGGQEFDPKIAAADPTTQGWARQSIEYLKDASSQGQTVALGQLAQLYENGIVVSPDIPQALMYASAVATVLHPDADVTQNAWVANLSRQISPAEAATAVQSGVKLAQQCCATRVNHEKNSFRARNCTDVYMPRSSCGPNIPRVCAPMTD